MTTAKPPKMPRSVVLVGLMGAGKTAIGRELAARLELPFVDADSEIEAAAGCTIEDIFALYGETEFRSGERRVISRLLDGPVRVIAAGGGAFMDAKTRRRIGDKGISVWLRADLDLLVSRVARRKNRPLLKGGDARKILEKLMAERYPVYAEADITIDTGREPPETTVKRALRALRRFAAAAGEGALS